MLRSYLQHKTFKQVFLRYRIRISCIRGSYVAFKPGSHMPWESPFCSEQFKNCFLFPFGDCYRIGFVAKHSFSSWLPAMCLGNRNVFYSAAALNSCLGYLFYSECYASLAVLLTHILFCSLSCSRRLLPTHEYQALGMVNKTF